MKNDGLILTRLQTVAGRLHVVAETLVINPERRQVGDQLIYAARRLQAHGQKPLGSPRQLTIIGHDLAAAVFWLAHLVDSAILPAARLAPLRQELSDLLDSLLALIVHPAARPAAALSQPAPPPVTETPAPAPVVPPAPPPRSPSPVTQVALDGQTYAWDGQSWYDRQYLKPPEIIIRQLNDRLTAVLAQADDAITDVQELAERARIARENMQYDRAELLARRILTLEPNNQMGAAVLCAALRAHHRPNEALAETEAFRRTGNPALLTSRAAAYCDLGLWAEAKQEVGRALAIQASEEAFLVVGRIKAARPELYG